MLFIALAVDSRAEENKNFSSTLTRDMHVICPDVPPRRLTNQISFRHEHAGSCAPVRRSKFIPGWEEVTTVHDPIPITRQFRWAWKPHADTCLLAFAPAQMKARSQTQCQCPAGPVRGPSQKDPFPSPDFPIPLTPAPVIPTPVTTPITSSGAARAIAYTRGKPSSIAAGQS